MGIDRANLAGAAPWWTRTTSMRSTEDTQRDDVDAAHGSPVARPTRTFGTVANGLSLLQPVARSGVLDRILEALQVRLDANGSIDWDLWCIDGSSVRASRAAAGASKKVSTATRKSPQITHWAAHAADSGASSTWLLTVRDCRWRWRSVLVNATNRNGSSR